MLDESRRIEVKFPRRETGVWNEIILWSLFNCIGQSINLMTMFYHYLITSCPNIVLFFYLFLYCVSAKYIFDLGGLLNVLGEHDEENGIGIARTKPSLVPTEDKKVKKQSKHLRRGLSEDVKNVSRRIYPQTKKSTPVRYQKGKYKHLVQGARRKLPKTIRGRPPRGRLRRTYSERERENIHNRLRENSTRDKRAEGENR